MGIYSVKDHVNTELREYALYTLSCRALPCLIDGFKPSQRKALFTAIKVANGKSIKTAALAGAVMAANYHHGTDPLNEAIVGMAAPHTNLEPILEGVGSFGSRLVPHAASPRYTEVKLGKAFSKYFADNDILETSLDPENPEPKTYLPLIPWVLVNGIRGIATGFATAILPRRPEQLAQSCIEYLKTGEITSKILPTFKDFSGNISVDESSYVVEGTIERKTGTKLTITEIPVGIDRTKYVSILDDLVDKSVIVSYEDECSKSGFQFSIVVPRSSKNVSDADWLKKLKLVKKVSENLSMISPEGELKIYDDVNQVIKDFVDYRLTKYFVRYAYYIARDTKKRTLLAERVRFCDLVIAGTIILKDTTRAQLLSQLTKLKFSKEHREKFVELSITSLTKDSIVKIKKDISALDKSIQMCKNIDYEKQYIKELEAV